MATRGLAGRRYLNFRRARRRTDERGSVRRFDPFYITPAKWAKLVELAKKNGRDGPDLVVYRTKTTDPHDHYVLPFALMNTFLTEATAPPRKDGTRRWELTLPRSGRFHVTHGDTVDVRSYHGTPLRGQSEHMSEEAIADEEAAAYFEAHEGRCFWVRHRQRERDRSLVAEAKARAGGAAQGLACRACGFDFERTYGELGMGFIEIHHGVALATYADEGGATRIEDLVAVCSNCHRMLHRRRPWLTVSGLTSLLHS